MNRTFVYPSSYPSRQIVTVALNNIRLLFLFTAALFISSVSSCFADPPPLPAPDKATERFLRDLKAINATLSFQQASLSTIIAELTKQSGRNILVNDEPRQNQADIEFKGSLTEALDKVADAYDYAWTVNKRGVILMTKRFSRKEEYPPLNAAELHETAKDALAVLTTFNFNPLPDGIPLILAVYSSLTPEQKAALHAGQKLRFAQLNAEQVRIVEEAILNQLLARPFNTWSMSADQLQSILHANPASHLRLHRYDFSPTTATGIADVASHLWSFEYVTIDKRGKELLLGLFAMRDLPAKSKQDSVPNQQEKK